MSKAKILFELPEDLKSELVKKLKGLSLSVFLRQRIEEYLKGEK